MPDGHFRILLLHDFVRFAMPGPFHKLALPESGGMEDQSTLLDNCYAWVSTRRGEAYTMCDVAGTG